MLAQENEKIERAVSSAWQLTEDEQIREQIWRREDNERIWNTMVRDVENAHKKLDKALEDNSNLKAELVAQKATIAELEAQLAALTAAQSKK